MREVYCQWAGVGQTTVPAEDENAIREHLCIRAYLVLLINNNNAHDLLYLLTSIKLIISTEVEKSPNPS